MRVLQPPAPRVHGQRIRSFRAMESSRNVVVAAVLLLQVVVAQSEPFVHGPAAAAAGQVRRPIFLLNFFFFFLTRLCFFLENICMHVCSSKMYATKNFFLKLFKTEKLQRRMHFLSASQRQTVRGHYSCTLFVPGHLDPVRLSRSNAMDRRTFGRIPRDRAEYPRRSLRFRKNTRATSPVTISIFSKQNSTSRISVIINRYKCWTHFRTIRSSNTHDALTIDKIAFFFFFNFHWFKNIYFTTSIKGEDVFLNWDYVEMS